MDSANLLVTAVADAPRLLGAERITNGTFDTNISSWTTTGTVDWNSNGLRFGASNAVGPHTASQIVSTVAGQTYELSFTYRDDSTARNQSLIVTANGSANLLTTPQIVTSVQGSSNVTYYYTFVADSSSTTITFNDTSDTSGLTTNGTTSVNGIIDNVSVRQSNGSQGSLAYTENSGAQAIYSTLSLNDVDSTNMTGATIQIATGFVAAQDTLTFVDQNGITGFYNSTTGTLTLSGTATRAAYETALQSITYSNSSEAPSASRTVTFAVNDGTNTNLAASRDIAITAINDAPVLTPYSPTLTLSENGSAFPATLSTLIGSSVTDADSGAVQGIAITGLTLAGGTLEYSLDGTNWNAVSGVSTTNALLLRSTDQMRFTPSTANGGTTLISYNAWDQTSGSAGGFANATTTGGSTAFSAASDTITVNVTSVNDAPVLDNTGTITLNAITEDNLTNAGQSIASMIASAGGDRITDVDTGAVEGIAVTATSVSGGNFQYSIDGGTTWNSVAWNVSNTNALLLRSSDLVRFVPNGSTAETGTMTFRAWDQTSGSVGSYVSTATNGGTTAFSTATEIATVTTTAVNDAPAIAQLSQDAVVAFDFESGLTSITGSGPALTVASPVTVSSSAGYTAGSNGLLFNQGDVTSVTNPVSLASIPNVASTNQFSFTSWVKFEAGTGNHSYERIFDFGAGASNNNITFGRYGTTNDLVLQVLSGSTSMGQIHISNALSGINGQWHHFAVTLDATGAAFIFKDGVVVGSGQFSGLPNYSTWTKNYLGSSNWSADKQFQGAMDDVGIFSRTLSAAEVASLANTSTSQRFTIAENSANATVVGKVYGGDPDSGTLSYSIVSQTSAGAFAIGSSTGQVTVANSLLVNYEAGATQNVVVRVSDGALTFDETITINLTDVNEAPTIAANTGSTVLEGSTGNVISSAMLNEGDPDDSGTGVVYTVTSNVTHGALKLNGAALSVGQTFTQADINAGLITYDHDDSELFVDSFGFSMADGGEDGTTPAVGTFNLTITPVNDNTPVITSNGGGNTASISINETRKAVTTVTATDADLPTQTLTYSIFGGADSTHFAINSSGQLSFIVAPDFEIPVDSNGDNIYEVVVSVSDGTFSDTQTITVTVLDVSSSVVVTTSADTNDSGLGAAYTIEELNAVGGGSDGQVSLREAIIAANNSAGIDTISFAIGNSDAGRTGTAGVDGRWILQLASALPTLTEGVVLDATTQTTFAGNTNVGTLEVERSASMD